MRWILFDSDFCSDIRPLFRIKPQRPLKKIKGGDFVDLIYYSLKNLSYTEF